MKSKKVIILGALVLLGIIIFSLRDQSVARDQASTTEAQKGTRTLSSQKADRAQELATKSFLPMDRMTPALRAILEGYDSGDTEALEAVFLEWLEKDEAAALAALESLDGLVSVYGLSAPEKAIAEYLMEKYSGEEAMELLASYPQVSTVVKNVMTEAIIAWGRKDIGQVQDFIQTNEEMKDMVMFHKLFQDQVSTGNAQTLADFLTKLPEADPRREQSLGLHYSSWVAQQPDEFAKYVNTLKDTTLASDAITVYAMDASSDDIDGAFEWANAIQTKDGKEVAILGVATQLAVQSPEKFQAWFEQQSFENEQEKQAFLQRITSGVEGIESYVPPEVSQEEMADRILAPLRQKN